MVVASGAVGGFVQTLRKEGKRIARGAYDPDTGTRAGWDIHRIHCANADYGRQDGRESHAFGAVVTVARADDDRGFWLLRDAQFPV